MTRPVRRFEALPVKLTALELADRHKRLVEALDTKSRHLREEESRREVEKSRSKAAMAAIEGEQIAIDALVEAGLTGEELRQIECEEQENGETHMIETIRLDTNAFVSARPMSYDEIQKYKQPVLPGLRVAVDRKGDGKIVPLDDDDEKKTEGLTMAEVKDFAAQHGMPLTSTIAEQAEAKGPGRKSRIVPADDPTRAETDAAQAEQLAKHASTEITDPGALVEAASKAPCDKCGGIRRGAPRPSNPLGECLDCKAAKRVKR